MKDLRGRNALVTGGSRGLGPHLARALAAEGMHVALTARAAGALESTAAELRAMGVRAAAIPADVTDPSARERLLAEASAALGPIDVLVNNAGLEWVGRYVRLSAEDIETIVRTNLVAPLILARLALPAMLARGSGHVVTMSSLGGKKGSPYSATYAATKAGLIEWTSGIREELRGSGVSASVVCPGFVAEAGMFAAYGERAPRIAGATTPAKVAAAVVRAIRDDVAEIVVNPGPVRLMAVANAVSPALMTRVLRACGLYDFYRRRADANEAGGRPRLDAPPPPGTVAGR